MAEKEVDPKPGQVMRGLFPYETGTHVSDLLGVPRRSGDRLVSGYSRTPPALLGKLETQLEHKRQFQAIIRQAILDAEAAGLHPYVVRQTLLQEASMVEDEGDHDPL